MSRLYDNNTDYWLYNKIIEFFDNGGTLEGLHNVLADVFKNYKLVDSWEDRQED